MCAIPETPSVYLVAGKPGVSSLIDVLHWDSWQWVRLKADGAGVVTKQHWWQHMADDVSYYQQMINECLVWHLTTDNLGNDG